MIIDRGKRSKKLNQLSNPNLSHIEQESQEGLIQGNIHIQQYSSEDLEYW